MRARVGDRVEIAGLPPLNGFASEWMLFQAFLFSPSLPSSYLSMLVPVATAALALAVAMAGYVMVKFYGVVFLGLPREELAQAHDADHWERAGLSWLAAWCVALGLLPALALTAVDPIARALLGATLQDAMQESSWLFLTALHPERASYSAPLFLLGIVLTVLATFLLVRRFYHGRVRRSAPWDCGFGPLAPRMQDSAEGFSQPVKQIFEPFFKLERLQPSPFDAQPLYRSRIEDRFWYWIYVPVIKVAELLSSLVAVLHHGRIHLYLIYSFATLLVLLLLIQ